jgi:glycosyltransferase involved in cell wall biosynthesis
MHILFLTDNYPPEVNAPASRTYEHCRAWARSGCKVTVITCAPNFPTGRVFDGYRNRLWQAEEQDGIRVIRVWSYITANEGFLRRVLDYISYMISAFIASLFVKKVDVIVGTSPQFFTACAAYLAATVKRRPWVFELRDLWPESIRAVGAMGDSATLRMLERIELFLYRKASLIVAVTNAFCDNLIQRGIDPGKIEVVFNGADTGRFKPREKDAELLSQLGLEGKFVAGYVGTHGMAHALGTILDTADLCRQQVPDGGRFHFILLGEGSEKAQLLRRAGASGLDNVTFLDAVSKDQVARYWSLLDVSIIHLKRTDLFKTVIPSKLFECMAMGIPVLHGVEGESAEIVEREDVGLAFEPENPASLLEALLSVSGDPALRQSLSQNGPQAVRSFDREVLAGKMLALIESVARKDGS